MDTPHGTEVATAVGASTTIDARSAAVGIAGVNTRPLMRAADPMIGIAGNWGSTLRPHVARVTEPGASISKTRLGDQAAIHASKRACYFLDYTYLACPDRRDRPNALPPWIRRSVRTGDTTPARVPGQRRLPRVHWRCPGLEQLRTILRDDRPVHPNGAMAKDTVGDQDASRRGYERMCTDGYDGITIPVWQIMPCWVSGLSVEANALLASRDPVPRFIVTGRRWSLSVD